VIVPEPRVACLKLLRDQHLERHSSEGARLRQRMGGVHDKGGHRLLVEDVQIMR
jgi:hypothetical protein